MIQVREINQIEGLCELRPAWQALLDQTPGASFFHSLDWLECYWKHFAAGQQFRVLVATESRQPIGIMPLVVRTESTRVGLLRMLTYPLQDWATFFGPIGPNPSATLVAGLRHVRQTPRNWDVLDLRWVDVEAPTWAAPNVPWPRPASIPADKSGIGPRWLNCPRAGGPTGKVATPSSTRTSMAFSGAWWNRAGWNWCAIGPNRIAGAKLIPAGISTIRASLLAQRSWQGESGDKTNLCHAPVSGFLREAHAAAAGLGAVDLNLLYFNDEPAAFMYNYRWQDAVYGLRRGFDPRFKHLRPGLVLQKMMLEDGHRRGDRCYDLGTGSHDSKQAWRTGLQTSYRFTFFPALVLRAQLLRWNRWLRRRLRGEHDIACSQVV